MFKQSFRSEKSEPEKSSENQTERSGDENPVSVGPVASQNESVFQEAEAETTTADSEGWQAKYELLQDQFARLAADFDNFRKRIREEQASLARYGSQKTVMELLPVLDNLDRATSGLTEKSDSATLYKSFNVLQKQLLDGLETLGVKKMSVVGQAFDPQYHEAVNQMESAEIPESHIIYEAQSGYQLHDKVIRPAMVVVSTGSPEAAIQEAAPAEMSGNPFLK